MFFFFLQECGSFILLYEALSDTAVLFLLLRSAMGRWDFAYTTYKTYYTRLCHWEWNLKANTFGVHISAVCFLFFAMLLLLLLLFNLREHTPILWFTFSVPALVRAATGRSWESWPVSQMTYQEEKMSKMTFKKRALLCKGHCGMHANAMQMPGWQFWLWVIHDHKRVEHPFIHSV